MDAQDFLAERFEENRSHLTAVAYRMLGTSPEADDAVQEAWLRLSRTEASGIDNLAGWLTTVVARVSLDMLRSRKLRREQPLETHLPEPATADRAGQDPESEAVMADSLGFALLIVLDTLTPDQRLAFVLHDMFAVPFAEIADIVGTTPSAARQLASRARRRVQGTSSVSDVDVLRRKVLVEAFLAASRGGDFNALLALLDPDVVLRADQVSVTAGALSEVRGARAVADTFSGRAKAAQLALIDGAFGAVWAPGGRPRVVFCFAIEDGRITGIEMVAEPARLGEFDLVMLGGLPVGNQSGNQSGNQGRAGH